MGLSAVLTPIDDDDDDDEEGFTVGDDDEDAGTRDGDAVMDSSVLIKVGTGVGTKEGEDDAAGTKGKGGKEKGGKKGKKKK